MSDLISYAEVIRREANRVRVFDDLAKWLEHVGSLEQATTERDQMLGKAKEKLAVVMTQVSDAEAKLAHAGEKIAAATAEANKLVSTGRGNAVAAEKAGEERAAKIVSEAQTAAEEAIKEATARAESLTVAASQDAARLKRENADTTAALQRLRDESETVRKELAAMTAKIDETRKVARQLMGG